MRVTGARRAVGRPLAYVAFATVALYTHYYAVLARVAVAFLYAPGVLWLTRRPRVALTSALALARLPRPTAIALLSCHGCHRPWVS
ncbi:MAG: hypothetical protein U0641_02735 [Anaerolineae bacterium]